MAECTICGGRTAGRGQVLELEPIEEGGEPEGRQVIRLCSTCLEERREHTWTNEDSRMDILRQTLADRPGTHDGRFIYLAATPDESEIHLVRLRPDWVRRHQGPSEAQAGAV